MDKIPTHYDTLKVTRDAPLEVIRGAYKGLSQIYHPDKNSRPDAASMMADINTSYRILANPLTRIDHDTWIQAQEEATKPAPTNAINEDEPLFLVKPTFSARVGGYVLDTRKRMRHVAFVSALALLLGYAMMDSEKKVVKEYQPVSIIEPTLVSTSMHSETSVEVKAAHHAGARALSN